LPTCETVLASHENETSTWNVAHRILAVVNVPMYASPYPTVVAVIQ
jgi:hypothetical protein